MADSKKYGINTRAIHTQKKFELPTGDVMPPLHMSTTFENTEPCSNFRYDLKSVH